MLLLGETEGLSLAEGEVDDDGETLALSELDGLTEGDGETEGEALEDGDALDDGLTLGEVELEGLAELLGDTLNDSLLLGETLAEGLTEADTLLLSSAACAKERFAIAENPDSFVLPSTTRRIPEEKVRTTSELFAGQLAAVWTEPCASAKLPLLVLMSVKLSREV